MIHRILKGRAIFLASALAGLLMAACNNSEESTVNASEPGQTKATDSHADASGGVQYPGGSGVLPEPKIPTAAQINALEAMSKNAKTPTVPPASAGFPALAKTSAADFNLNFNDFTALAFLPDHAWITFAPFYIQKVTSTAWVYVFPLNDGHFHLMYENPNLCFGTVTGKYGVLSGGRCVQTAGDAASQPRNLAPHEATEKVQVYVWDGSRRYTFDFKSFYLPPTTDTRYGHVQIWIHKIDVGWRYWADLPSATGGFTWSLPQSGIGGAQGIDEIQITSPGTFGWTIDNLVINVH